MKTTFGNTLRAALAAALLASALPAGACCGDGALVATEAKKNAFIIVQTIEAAATVMKAWLERLNTTIAIGFGKVAAEIMKQTAAMRVMAEGHVATTTHLYMEKARADAQTKYELSPRACYEIASGAAGGMASDRSTAIAAGLSDEFARRTLHTPNTMAAVGKIYDEHVSKYCSDQDAQLGRCQKPVDPQLQNADVRADVTFNPSAYNGQQMEAARSLAMNVVNPIPTQNIPRNWERVPEGKTFVAGQLIEQARASIAAHSFASAIASRTRIPGLGTAAMLDKADVSEQQLLESQVQGRFGSPAWYKMIAGFSLENLMRESNKVMAYQAWQGLQTVRQNERMEAMLATQLAMDVKRDSEQRQREARLAAAKAAR